MKTLESICPQLDAGDEILVVRSDHPWGHQARNEAMPRCRGSHIVAIDDDDRYMKGALELVREQVQALPKRVHLFSMANTSGVVIKPEWPLREGHVGTPMICVPRVRGKVGKWGDRYEGDFDFIYSTMALRRDTPVLHDDVIALVAS